MRHKRCTVPLLRLTVIVLALLLGASVPSAWAQKASRVVAVSIGDVNGHVEILSRSDVKKGADAQILSEQWKRATSKANLNVGDQIRTDVDASLQLHLNDGTLLTLGSETLLRVENLQSARGSTPRTAVFALEQGTVSTRQTSKILGQTVQIIRTANGSVDTRLGEVEVHKPQQQYQKLAALPTQWPLFVQSSGEKNRTLVNLFKGTAQIEATGIGQIITTSTLQPKTCLATDGVFFTLKVPKEKVKIAHMPDINGFELSSPTPFQLLVATEGESDKVTVKNLADSAEIGVEESRVAELRNLSSITLGLNPLLTVDVISTNVLVTLGCTGQESRGLDYEILASNGNITILRDSLGGGGITRLPSRGDIATQVPTVPPFKTPTPKPSQTPVDEETLEPGKTPVPTATPTLTPSRKPAGPRPTSAPTRIPVTHTFPRNPVINAATVSVVVGGNCLGAATHEIFVESTVDNYLPQIFPGRLESTITSGIGSGQATSYYNTPGDLTTAPSDNYQYAADNQLETVTFTHSFCYNESSHGVDLSFFYYVFDREGNRSNRMTCTGVLSSTVVCN